MNVKDVLDNQYNTVEEYKGNYQIFEDQIAPLLVKSELNAGTLKLTFNKPLAGNPTTIKVDDVTVSEVRTSTEAGKYEVTATGLTNDQKSLGNHSVKVYGAKDFAGNTASLLTGSYTVTADSEKPKVENISVESQDTFKVTFDSSISSIVSSNFEVKKGNYTFPIDQLTVDQVEGETNTYTVKISGTTTNPLYAEGENSVVLNVKVKDFKGTNDVFGDDYSASVTLAKDLTPPTIQSASLNRVEGGKLVLIFNEKVTKLDSAKISVTKDGVIESVNTNESNTLIDPTDTKKLLIDVGGLTAGTYNVTLAKGAVEDLSGNENNALTTTVVNKGNVDTAIQPQAVTGTGATQNGKNVLTINYGSGKKMTDSALNLANYKLDGVPLNDPSFVGTTIGFTSSDKEEVKITLAKGNIKGDKTEKLVEISKNVKTDAGEFIADSEDKTKAYTIINEELNDDIAPVLEKSEFVKAASSDTTSNIVKLTFSKAVTSTDSEDYLVRIGGTRVAVSNIIQQEGDKEVVLKLATSVNLSQSGTLEITTDKDYNTNGTIEIQDTLNNNNKSIAKQVSLSTSIVDASLVSDANPEAPEAPTAVGGIQEITSVDDTMEYRAKGESSWTAVPTGETSITELTAGEYEVRVAESTDGLTPAGEIQTVTVAAE